MDFLISVGFATTSQQAIFQIETGSLDPECQLQETSVGRTHILHSRPLLRDKNSQVLYCFDGNAISQNIYANFFRSPTYLEARHLFSRPDDVCGSYAIIEIDSNGHVIAEVDNLSQYLLYYASVGPSRHVISNNPYFVEDFLDSHNVPVKRSVDAMLATMVYNSGLWGGSGYENISIIRNDETLKLDGSDLHVTTLKPDAPLKYADAIEMSAQTISAAVEKMLSSVDLSEAFYDLTGGMDSRVIFAALKAYSLHDRLPFFTVFDYPHNDGHYAGYLAERYGLKAHKFKKYDFNHGKPYGRMALKDSDRLKYQALTGYGIESTGEFVGLFQEKNMLRLHGGYGELGGSSSDVKRAIGWTGQNATLDEMAINYNKCIDSLKYADYLKDERKAHFKDHTFKLFNEVRDSCNNDSDAPQLIYNRGRNRTHFARLSKIRSRLMQYPDLLCTRYLQDAGQGLSLEQKGAGKVNFDLARALGGDEAVSIPLADSPWSELADPENISGRQVISSAEPKMFKSPMARSFPANLRDFDIEEKLKPLSSDVRQTIYMQREIKDALHSDSPAIEAFNAKKLKELSELDPEIVTPVHRRVMTTAYMSSIWAERGEKRFKLGREPSEDNS